jgi:hypothetical protein
MVMGMARLIDADLLLQWVENLEAYNMGRSSCFRKPKGLTPEGMRHMIDTMPKVDAVPVVRCKDCKHFFYNSECNKHSEYGTYITGHTFYTSPDDFCSHGERRTDE